MKQHAVSGVIIQKYDQNFSDSYERIELFPTFYLAIDKKLGEKNMFVFQSPKISRRITKRDLKTDVNSVLGILKRLKKAKTTHNVNVGSTP